MQNKYLTLLKVLCLTLIFCAATSSISAQTLILKGKIIDSKTFEPLIGASIFINETTNGGITDGSGEFSITVNREIPFTISVSYTGYKSQQVEITPQNKDNVVTINLEEGIDFNEVVVSASRRQEKALDAPAAINLIDSREIENNITASPIFALRNATGVDVAQNGVSSGHINLRGRVAAYQTETFVIADYRNVTLPSLGAIQYGQQPLDAIDLDRVEIVRGPGGALYGPGVEAGVVHFISKSPFKHKGTSISVGGGNQSQFQAAFRHANTSFDKKFGYKITGFYRTAQEFQPDSTNERDDALIAQNAAYPDSVFSSIDGSFISDNVLDYRIMNLGINVSAEYKFSQSTSLIANAGYGKSNQIIRVAQGDGYTNAGRPFAQLRFQSGNFFAQTFWSKQMGGDGSTWFYATGRTLITEIDQVEGQIQYSLNLTDDKLNLTFGADYRDNFISTENTLNGRYEDQDEYGIYGAYAQGKLIVSPKVDFIGAVRVDRFTALNKTAISPRFAVIAKPAQNHTVRLTWNQAAGAPLSLNLHGDFAAADRGAFLIWANAGNSPLTYNKGEVYSFITKSNFPDKNFPLQVAYGAATQGLANSGVLSPELVAYLSSELLNVSGTTLGVGFATPTTPAEPRSRAELKMSQTQMFELGYNGVISNKLSYSLDVFYTTRTNNLTPLSVGSPLIGYPTAGDDLAAVVTSTLNADSLAKYNFTPAQAAAAYKQAIETLTLNAAGGTNPLGLISSDQSPTGRTLDGSFYNIEKISYTGIDFGAKYYLSNDFSVFANYSWISQHYWEDAKLTDLEATTTFSLNTPENRARLGFDFLPATGFNANAAVRYTSAWKSVNGYWTGDVPASTIVDLGVGYAFTSGLRVNVTATNLLNATYQPIAGATSIGRLILAKVTYTFKGK